MKVQKYKIALYTSTCFYQRFHRDYSFTLQRYEQRNVLFILPYYGRGL